MTTTNEVLRMTAEMRDKLSGPLRRLRDALVATGRIDAFRRIAGEMSLAERAGYRFGRMLGTTIRVGSIAAAGAATAASLAMVKFGKDSADSLDDLAAFSKQVNFSAESMRTLQGVAARYNVDQGALRGGIERLSTNLGRLKNNQGGFYTYLKKTNPALAEQLKHTKSTEDAYVLLFGAMEKISDPTKRAALAKAAGIGQQALRFLSDGPEDLRKTIDEVKRLQGLLGPRASEDAARYGDAMDNIGLAWIGLRDKLTVSALPIVTPMLEDLANFVANNRDGIVSGFRSIATDVSGGIRSLAASFGSLTSDDWKSFWSDIKGFASTLATIARTVNDVVQSFGGWKVVIGAIVALKLGSWAKGLAGDAISLVPGGPAAVAGGAAAGAGAAASGAGWLAKALGIGRFAGKALGAVGVALTAAEVTKMIADAAVANRKRRILPEQEAQINETVDQLAEVTDILANMRALGAEEKYPTQYKNALRTKETLERRLVDLRAGLALLKREGADIGKKIGNEAGKSFFESLQSMFQRSSYSGGGGMGGGGFGGGSGGLIQAAYRPGGGGEFDSSSPGASYARGEVPKSMVAGASRAMQLLTAAGFNRHQAAALAGNIQQESGFNPNSLNRKEGAHGLLQWRGSRWSALQRFAAKRGTSPNDFGTQVAFIHEELTNPALGEAGTKAARAFLGAKSVSEANRALKGYIRYGDNSFGTRGRNAESILQRPRDSQLKDALRRDRERKQKERRDKIEGQASVDVRFHGAPAGTKVGAKASGLFREVRLDTGRTMKPALA